MIFFKTGNLFEEINKVEAIINTVNCVGVMGKGIALEFKKKFPNNFYQYKKACNQKEIVTGKMLVVPIQDNKTKYIINFPTKNHWRNPSKFEYIETGLDDLLNVIKKNEIKSIAIPALGCGNGQLDWEKVKPLIVNKLKDISNKVDVFIYEPNFSKTKEPKKNKPRLTKGRKSLLLLINRYNDSLSKEKVTHIETSHLAYLLQTYNENLNLKFINKKFGPYSEKVNIVLKKLNGYYIEIQQQKEKAAIVRVKNTNFPQKKLILNNKVYKKVEQLINGFETENAIMILAVVHWFFYEEDAELDNLFMIVKSWCIENNHAIQDDLIIKAIERLNFHSSKVENLSFDI